jgi:hypothetical protein
MKIFKPSILEIMIFSKEGNLELLKKIPLESLVAQFVQFSKVGWSAVAESIRDTINTLRAVSAVTPPRVDAGATLSAYGIQVGTGTNPVSISNYQLQAKIEHGNAAGQLYHQATIVSPVTIAGSDAYFTIQRNLNNNSGGTIQIQEAGLVGLITYNFLLSRELTGPIDVLNTKTLVGLYTFKVTAS